MSSDSSSFQLAPFFGEWSARLVNIVRGRLSKVMRKRVDAEDIVQSVFRTVWRRQQNGQMELKDEPNAWRLLVRIAINKTCRAVRFNKAGIRSVEKEVPVGLSAVAAQAKPADRTPLITEKLQEIAKGLSPTHRRILELRFDGLTVSQVAEELAITRQTVYRCLQMVKVRLDEELADYC